MPKQAVRNRLLNHLNSLSEVKRERLTYLILFLISFFLIISYFTRQGHLVQGIDTLMWVTHTDYYKSLGWVYTWYDRTSLGFVRIPSLLEISMSLGDDIIRDPSWIYRIVLLLVIFSANLGSYLYIKNLTKDTIASLVGAFFYVSNPWFLHEVVDGHIDILIGVSLFPWLPLALEKRKVISTALLGSVFLTAAHPQDIYAFGFLFIAYLFVTLRADKHDISYVLSTFALTCGLSMFYIIPFVFVNGLQGFSGLKPWAIEDISEFILPTWLVLLRLASVLFLGVMVSKYGKNYRHARFYFVVAMVITFLASSPSLPVLDGVYLWMFRNVPFFSIFRVPARLMMVTIFCVTCMIGIAISRTRTTISTVKLPFHKGSVSSGKIFKTILVGSIISVFAISSLATGSISLGNYTPDSVWISNHEWLRNQPFHFEQVYTLPVTSGWISTPYGTTQDYGALSTLFSGKPVIGTPARTATSYPFLKYLEYVVRNNITDQMLKLLGAIDVKYVTSGPNMLGQETFLLKQEGMENNTLVYANGEAKVYENPYWTPMFKVATDADFLAGGYSDVASLLRLSLNLNNSVLYFPKPQENKNFTKWSSIIYEDFVDYLMLTLNTGIKIHACQFGVDYTRDPRKDWIKDDRWKIEGKFVINDLTLSVTGEHAFAIPFKAEENGTYEVFGRILSGPEPSRGYLTVGNTSIRPSWSLYAFKWYDFGEMNLTNGQNLLQIRNSGERNDIDEIVLVKKSDLENHSANVIRELQDSEERVILSNKAYNIFNVTQTSRWIVSESQFDSDGHVLHGSRGAELRLGLTVGSTELNLENVFLPKAGNYTLLLRARTNGNVILHIGNETKASVGNGEYGLHAFDLPYLGEGTHGIRFYFSDDVDLDDVVIYSPSKEEKPLEVFPSVRNENIVAFVRKVSPVEYVLNIENSDNRSFLMTSISYDDRWKAFVDGDEVSPVRMNDVLLSFPLNKTGSFQMRLVFAAQEYVFVGFWITLASLSIVVLVLFAKYIRIKKGRMKNNADRRLLALI